MGGGAAIKLRRKEYGVFKVHWKLSDIVGMNGPVIHDYLVGLS
jgi:hypothetical protein